MITVKEDSSSTAAAITTTTTSTVTIKAVAENVTTEQQRVFHNMLSEEAVAKIVKVAQNAIGNPDLPHCTEMGSHGEKYLFEPAEWWTCGFFPGSLWTLVERSRKVPLTVSTPDTLRELAEKWAAKIEPQQTNTETHDIGFMIMPSFNRLYHLDNKDKRAAQVIVTAADSLLTRFNHAAQAIKSWNLASTKIYEFGNLQGTGNDLLVIIDNMMNLDLLYTASNITGNAKYAQIATAHAETTLKYFIREDWSTYHLVVFNAETGARKVGLTAQGYKHDSCWARGQAWALYGFASVYQYTRQRKFLDAALKLADYFVSRLGDNGEVFWDFDAARPCVWDASAATIAASGMLLICQLEESHRYLPVVAKILDRLQQGALTGKNGATILDHATVNNFPYAHQRNFDTGLVYADYYYLEAGNRLVDMKLV